MVVILQRFSAINILWTACELMRMMRYAAEGLTYCQGIFCSPTKAVARMLVLLVLFECVTCSCCFPQLECYCNPSPWWQLDEFYTRVMCWAYLHNFGVVRLSQRQRSRCVASHLSLPPGQKEIKARLYSDVSGASGKRRRGRPRHAG